MSTRPRHISEVMPALAISIDNFLDAHKGDELMETCGKLGIAKTIFEEEAQSKLSSTDHSGRFELRKLTPTWYARFFEMLTENVSKENAAKIFDNIAVISFNYDRCIERFLVQAVADYYQFDISEAEQIVKKLKIWHPYGTVGKLPWQGSEDVLAFGSKPYGDLLKLSKRIKTFTESSDDDMLKQSREAIVEAEILIFLGFAFHPMNMSLLTPGRETKTLRVFATTFGLSPSDVQVIEMDVLKMLGKYPSFTGSEVQLEFSNSKCSDFFKSYFRSLSASF